MMSAAGSRHQETKRSGGCERDGLTFAAEYEAVIVDNQVSQVSLKRLAAVYCTTNSQSVLSLMALFDAPRLFGRYN